MLGENIENHKKHSVRTSLIYINDKQNFKFVKHDSVDRATRTTLKTGGRGRG